MDYQRFIEQLPGLYDNWGLPSVQPKSRQFRDMFCQVQGMTTPNITQLLNFALACMEADEVYCEVGCFQGATLVGALLNHPERVAYAIDNFSEFDILQENQGRLMQNLAMFNLQNQVFFCNQDFEAFFADLRELQTSDRIGVYFYDGAHDYRSQLMGLLLARPFLAERALIIVDDSNWEPVQQANWDFIAAHPECDLLLDLPTPSNGHPTFWNGLQILRWDAQARHNYYWADLQRTRKPGLLQAIYNLPALYEQPVAAPEIALDPPESQLQSVIQRCQATLQANQQQAEIWHELGTTWYLMERYDAAESALTQAVALEPENGRYLYSLGLTLEKQGKVVNAAQTYQKALSCDRTLLDAYNNLGNLVVEHGDPSQAEPLYHQAIQINPSHVGSYLNLGNLLLTQNRLEEAIQTYLRALELEPANSAVLENLEFAHQLTRDERQALLFAGNSHYQRQQYRQAAIYYQALLDQQSADLDLYSWLADCYEKSRQYDRVIQVCNAGTAQHPTAIHLYKQLLQALRETNQTDRALALAEQATIHFPEELYFALQKALLLPVLYLETAAIDHYRQHFSQGLTRLVAETSLASAPVRQSALQAIAEHTNFLLAYQNRNDRELQKQYGQFVHQVMAANYPDWVNSLPVPSSSGKIRVGYVSGCMWEHTVGKLMIGWLRYHDREQFEIYSYSLTDQFDALSQEYRSCSHAFHQFANHPDQLEAVCHQVLADQLHILVYFDIGQQATLTQLAALRLAPVQCATWVHPVTSGLPTIDYFLSSDLMEPDNACSHYSEELVRLPGIAITFDQPRIPATSKTRQDFGLPEDGVIYLCSQLLCKFLPQDDGVLVAIARRVPKARFVFLERPNSAVASLFQQRLQQTFAAAGLDSNDHCLFLPPQTQLDYWNLNQLSDVFLDSFGWSGGHTTLEAIACGLPVVTCPGEFMRGRHSYGILCQLGVTETIAQSPREYIEIAVRLGIDRHWCRQVAHRMGHYYKALYGNANGLRGLEAFYRQVVAGRSKPRC